MMDRPPYLKTVTVAFFIPAYQMEHVSLDVFLHNVLLWGKGHFPK